MRRLKPEAIMRRQERAMGRPCKMIAVHRFPEGVTVVMYETKTFGHGDVAPIRYTRLAVCVGTFIASDHIVGMG